VGPAATGPDHRHVHVDLGHQHRERRGTGDPEAVRVSTESIQWISTSYTLTEGVIVPMSAWLGARVGLKRLYIWSLVLFTVASRCAVCPVTWAP